MDTETIVAVFDHPRAVEAACAELKAIGIPDDAISWTTDKGERARAVGHAPRERGFWHNLFGGEPDHDTGVYDRSVDEGSDVLTVRARREDASRVVAILERHEPIDLDERAESFGLDRAAAGAADDTVYGRGDAILPLAAEQMEVGTRVVDRGTTRVRRFVVETPVEREVTLHSERARVERRPVTGMAEPAADFAERVVEIEEIDEVPVVAKTARVVEEVVVHRDVADRTETVRDTLRHEDVEITHDERGVRSQEEQSVRSHDEPSVQSHDERI